MSYQLIERSAWGGFCDHLSKLLEGQPVEVDMIGLRVGDQIVAKKLSLSGISYDLADDALNVYLQVDVVQPSPRRGHLEHTIRSPRELYAYLSEVGVSQLVVLDVEGNKQFVTLQERLRLPATTS